MRRLVVEWSIKDLIKKSKDTEGLGNDGTPEAGFPNQEIKQIDVQTGLKALEMLQKIKSFEILHFLRFDRDEFAAIFRVEIKDPSFKIEDLFNSKELSHGTEVKLQLLEREKEGICTYFMKGKPQPSSGTNREKMDMYPSLPFVIRDGKIRITFLGNNDQVKKTLEFFEKAGINYKVVSIMDAKFSPSSPVNRLTAKQSDAIILAFKLGYFDTPRKISSEQLATKLGLANSTLAVHLRRAERRLLAEMLNE